MKKPESICIFGDSTAWGAWDFDGGGWATRLWQYIGDRDEYVELFNLSIPGGTSESILNRFESEAKMRKADALVFQTGGNDACMKSMGGPNNVPIEKFAENIQAILTKAKKITSNIIFIGLKNVDESRTTPVSWMDSFYANSEAKKYNEVVEKICRENNVKFLNMFGAFVNSDYYDGIHPTSDGHKRIFVAVRDFLTQHNWI